MPILDEDSLYYVIGGEKWGTSCWMFGKKVPRMFQTPSPAPALKNNRSGSAKPMVSAAPRFRSDDGESVVRNLSACRRSRREFPTRASSTEWPFSLTPRRCCSSGAPRLTPRGGSRCRGSPSSLTARCPFRLWSARGCRLSPHE